MMKQMSSSRGSTFLDSGESLLLSNVLPRRSKELLFSQSTCVSSHRDYVDFAGGLVDELFCLLKELFVSSRFSLKILFIKV